LLKNLNKYLVNIIFFIKVIPFISGIIIALFSNDLYVIYISNHSSNIVQFNLINLGVFAVILKYDYKKIDIFLRYLIIWIILYSFYNNNLSYIPLFINAYFSYYYFYRSSKIKYFLLVVFSTLLYLLINLNLIIYNNFTLLLFSIFPIYSIYNKSFKLNFSFLFSISSDLIILIFYNSLLLISLNKIEMNYINGILFQIITFLTFGLNILIANIFKFYKLNNTVLVIIMLILLSMSFLFISVFNIPLLSFFLVNCCLVLFSFTKSLINEN